jgi:hypothetical protein
MMRSALIKTGKEVLKAFGFEENSWMNADACTISDNKGLLLWIVFRHSTALAVVFADKTMFQPIHDHFEESLFGEFATIQQKKRKEEKDKDQQKAKVRKREKQRRIPRAKWEGQLLTSSSITDAHSTSSMSRWTTDIQNEENYVKTVEEKLWEEAGGNRGVTPGHSI